MTREDVAAANVVIAHLASWERARSDAENIAQANAHGVNGAGLTIKLSDAIVHRIKRERIAECDAAIAELRRRAAQISLQL